MTISMFPPTWPDSPAAALWSFDKAFSELRMPANADASNRSRAGLLRALLVFGDKVVSTHQAPDNDVLTLLRQETAPLRHELAVCVLRLLPLAAMSDLCDAPWRPLITKLLQNSFPELGSPGASTQAHEYLVFVKRQVADAETRFHASISHLTSLEQLGAHRQQLLSILNGKTSRGLFSPFLPPDILPLLSETYTRAVAYLGDRGDATALESHRSAINAVGSLRTSLAAIPTTASAAILRGVAQKLEDLLENDFAKNKAVKPAVVNFMTAQKSYPLHIREHTISVAYQVTNEGPGYAQDVRLYLLADSGTISTPDVELGGLRAGVTHNFDTSVTLREPRGELPLLAQLTWTDFDGTRREREFAITLSNQRDDIDWVAASAAEPYSLEPIDSEVSLLGRRDLLTRIGALTTPSAAGSAIVHGQKRVGKTSLAKALRSRLQGLGHLVLYMESGDYVASTASATVQQLASRVSRMLRKHPRLSSLPPPETSASLAPLADYLDDVLEIIRPHHLIIILDEFDELPAKLFEREPEGNAFFLTLRSISSRPSVGLILVGSERMASILDAQGDKLNKWPVLRVDYFKRETDWSDYRELVSAPSSAVLEFSESAIEHLYEFTAGNPYFTNILCRLVYRNAVNRRDCDVTDNEIRRAAAQAVREVEQNAFQHFWEDGIAEAGPSAAERSVRRRRILIALADTLRETVSDKKPRVTDHPLVRSLAPIDADLLEFEARDILEADADTRAFRFKVPLFGDWLKERGVQDIISTFDKEDGELSARRREEELKVQPKELLDLTSRWTTYRGQHITDLRVQSWLAQFGSLENQRLMFTLLRHVHFFSHQFIRRKLSEAHDVVRRKLADRMGERAIRSEEVLVTYLDGPAKSSASLARLYTDEAGLPPETVTERSLVVDRISGESRVRAIVVVDDFVGTGSSAESGLRELHSAIGSAVMTRDIPIFFVATVAYTLGWSVISSLASELQFGLHVHCCEFLEESAKVFGDKSSTFREPTDRHAALKIAQDIGRQIEKRCPLGYGDLQLAVVFERGCPNNSLPILWSESNKPPWVPLFKRL